MVAGDLVSFVCTLEHILVHIGIFLRAQHAKGLNLDRKGTPKTNAALPKLDDVPLEFIGEELLRELTGPITAAAKPPGRRRHAGVRTVVVFLPTRFTGR